MGLKLSYADFFPGERFLEADEPLLRLPPNNFLVYGPHAAGLSTLLFHYAFSCASAGHQVTIVAPRYVQKCVRRHFKLLVFGSLLVNIIYIHF
jgi:hypothetical protein